MYTYPVYGFRQLKRKLVRSEIKKVTLSKTVPQLCFTLADKGDFYQLRVQVKVSNQLLKQADISNPFFVRDGSTLYLLNDFFDVVMAHWISSAGGVVTVFKEHYRKFEQEVLHYLSHHYPVKKIAHRKSAAYV